MNSPKVSIIIPVYNGSNFLANAIDCALNQTYENLEVIVVNDGSTDDGRTERIAFSYGDKIRYFSKPNGGVSSALNYGIRNMTGEYFSWLSHDDAYTVTKVADSVALLRKHEALNGRTIAYTGGYFMDSHGNSIGDFPGFFEENQMYSGVDVVKIMTQKGTLNGCCMLIPRNAFMDVGEFNESLRYSQDSLMWYKIFLAEYSLVCDNRSNVMYRLHRGQTSQRRRDLYEHDALVIAKLLAEPLMKAEFSGELLIRYIKRQTKYECTEAIHYLCECAEKNGYMNARNRIKIGMYRVVGFFRYRIVTYGKRILIWLRHR